MDALEIKAALNAQAEEFARWLLPAGKKDGGNWRVGSLNGESGKSLAVCITGPKVGVFRDFADGQSGGSNLLELYARVKQVDFKSALTQCADWLGYSLTYEHRPIIRQSKSAATTARSCDGLPYLLSDAQVLEAITMVEALHRQPDLCARVARVRGWKPETVCNLAAEVSLGWHDGKLAFIYETGVKLRWRQKDERIIKWAFGKPWLWRGSFLFDGATTAYVCEGETDCISLIDAGVENDGSTIAVAIPSASTFDRSWAELLDNKNVILAFDGDEAGLKATAKVSALLRAHVRTLKQLNWEGVRYANAR